MTPHAQARRHTRKQHNSDEPITQKLRAVTPEELDAWSSGSDSEYDPNEPQPSDLPGHTCSKLVALRSSAIIFIDGSFQAGDRVWIRTAGGNWHPGKVSGQTTRKGQTREKEGLFYPVVFNEKLRKYFAPLNGEIKPNNRHIRSLLADAGWL
ncbi:uncharacterized protein EV420DRAFT_1569852 [Desarmillaria tabescens]|uniref:PWWP domain-containing protein n=1 Tax=Armillaria tabescens TaxID=1929756 RepID=A0AA39MUI6_ARMTA|nr:uncharacterized protein EV420DRAFT_1569852 [Desarmillaria tabescens]KAK0446539.1 hypothetical protein EV420DRAFT_1569852 [Desarmillaria tabescens]